MRPNTPLSPRVDPLDRGVLFINSVRYQTAKLE
ncbi:MAG: hypothetical protein UU40_C0001G0045 [Candidatus Uhrbacteria bacterium GW2011_GWD2_41_121]|uniref:Uncharacterized protein n=1 Tax=Candidatus Uhrbacteria bacterium GW2011_GWC1_41_20 TaxID=1618983 RepID=A0A0G0YHZ4_9BACT|nr:MAG: hypothetical protein UT52_C0001G0025 [Candidatus Uhrbacteria bacterium GW2011_GWE1_39_46]KKR64414.1 MAG: hypothetical protein UU04_C0002G0025 [Candidatus Uhrbacteria bacterium GW2011_GWC2_40_450]KKR89765.1 MAG: hypothetical protein UU36_C0018G0008 [Candidatus Uhrbacteria bacterium GW2011_GWE2_41_1153]KKR90707.1 MAG: hypothetical protein UU40_C0001G0045 [Candidatus Uhrbacteria bacterium GW2011_GWD2_41_121]KKR96576.1 MAG: hypothetical protein UU46_C0001G0025 [Candidatus Uhrbacteria bacter